MWYFYVEAAAAATDTAVAITAGVVMSIEQSKADFSSPTLETVCLTPRCSHRAL